jgi:hypothetical protein
VIPMHNAKEQKPWHSPVKSDRHICFSANGHTNEVEEYCQTKTAPCIPMKLKK